jgi:hypothetical protein
MHGTAARATIARVAVRVFYDPRRVEQLRQKGISPRRQLSAGPAPEARTALELVEECAQLRAEVERLRRDNQRLSDENVRLAAASSRQPDSPPREHARGEERAKDDTEQRFSLLELD